VREGKPIVIEQLDVSVPVPAWMVRALRMVGMDGGALPVTLVVDGDPDVFYWAKPSLRDDFHGVWAAVLEPTLTLGLSRGGRESLTWTVRPGAWEVLQVAAARVRKPVAVLVLTILAWRLQYELTHAEVERMATMKGGGDA
jgi:hypothetical protein